MISFEKVAEQVESPDFSAKLNLASSRNLFIRILEEDSVVALLVSLIGETPETIFQVLSRVELLSQLNINPRYENPNDVAISAYCWALYRASPEIGRIASTFAVMAKGIWWAREIAVFILESNYAAQKEAMFNALVTNFSNFAEQNFTFVFKNSPPNFEEVSSIPVTLVKDVVKYKLVMEYMSMAGTSNKPRPKLFNWPNDKMSFKYNLVPSSISVLDTPRVANWK